MVLSTSYLLLVVIFCVFYMPGNVQGTGAPRPWNKSALIRDKVAQNNDKGIVIEQDMSMNSAEARKRTKEVFMEEVSKEAFQMGSKGV